jgi:hypothetical protein
LVGSTHDLRQRVDALSDLPEDDGCAWMVDELCSEVLLADRVVDVLWHVVAQGEADDADWFTLGRTLTGED